MKGEKTAVSEPFSAAALGFLNTLSERLRHEKSLKKREDIQAFAFWCRRASLEQMKELYKKRHAGSLRLGKGLAFHIAPANIPVMFAYTMAIGLLAGNSNLVRISGRSLEQGGPLLKAIEALLEEEKFGKLRTMIRFVSYDSREEDKTALYSALCDIRVIWGGDDTIKKIRSFPIKPGAWEITFPDRYSAAFLRESRLKALSGAELASLVHQFCADTYSIDQNACSSPSAVFWERDRIRPQKGKKAREMFWEMVSQEAKSYGILPIQISRKYGELCRLAATSPALSGVLRYGNILYVAKIEKELLNAETLLSLRGRYGMFFEILLDDESDLPAFLPGKIQTLTCQKGDEEGIKRMLWRERVQGVDRVVPFGQALALNLIWDGMDLIERMSREIR